MNLSLFLSFVLLTFFSLFVGWGAFYNIGHTPYTTRASVFDWLLGEIYKNEPYG